MAAECRCHLLLRCLQAAVRLSHVKQRLPIEGLVAQEGAPCFSRPASNRISTRLTFFLAARGDDLGELYKILGIQQPGERLP